ncbi:MAG TPA: YhdP family protein [Steroidobacteraceae bacterium]
MTQAGESSPTPSGAGEGAGASAAAVAAGQGGDGHRRFATRLWRVVAATAGGLLVCAALVITALRVAIAYLPQHADHLRAWVEQQTHMHIEYASLDARLRWYGPEVVLREVRILDEAGTQALFAAREASVGLDLWNFLRTGQFVAGRVRIAGPRVTIVRLADGRVRLLGQAERPADRPPFDLDRLPAGRLAVADATIVYRDLKTGRAPLELRDLQGELRRDRDFVVMEGSATLPASFGSAADFAVRLKGSLDELEHLDARLELRADTLRLAPLADFLPSQVARPLAGRGTVATVVYLRQGQVSDVRVKLGLKDVVLRLPARQVPPIETVVVTEPRVEAATLDGMPSATVTQQTIERPASPLPAEARFAALAGEAGFRREGEGWSFRLGDLRTSSRGASALGGANLSGKWWGRPVSRFGLDLEASNVDLGALWPLALAFGPAGFDRWAGAGLRGQVAFLQVTAGRDRAGQVPAFKVAADLRSIGVNAQGRWPGVAGITARLNGTDQRGRIELRATAPSFELPRLFLEPLQLTRATADLDWRREGETWIVGTRGARLVHVQAQASGDAELQFTQGWVSPLLTADARVERLDVAAVPQFLPAGRLHERTLAWLDRAFVRGSASQGRLSFRGPLRKFPFRHGEGEFRAGVDLAGVTLDYYPGFAPLTEAAGHVEFHNNSIEAQLVAGRVGGVRLTDTRFRLGDYKIPVLEIGVKGAGDLQQALAFVQASPLGPRIGTQFMGLRGDGPARYDVQLTLPIVSDEARAEADIPIPERDYFVRATLQGANVSLPALRAPAQRVTGVFELHNDAITAPSLRGTILDGPFELKASPGRLGRDVLAAVDLTARGRAGGARLPAFIGLPATVRMTGATDWDLRGRIEKHGPGLWPMQFDVNSTLAGIEIFAPRPFAKPSAEARATHVRIEFPGRPYNDVTIESGSARAKLRFATDSGQWRLDRGTARFDGQAAVLGTQRGLLVTGDWPQFDLAEWLALGDDTGAAAKPAGGQTLMDWLGPVDVHLERATVFGFELQDLVARLRGDGESWRVGVTSQNADGQVTVPADLSRGRPIVLEMKRLQLVSVKDAAPSNAAGTSQADPRKLPALQVRADDFSWEGRRFGQLDAVINRDARGLTFDRLQTRSPHLAIDATGSWLAEAGGVRTRLEANLTSGDFGAAARDLTYRDAIEAKKASITAQVWWPGGPSGDAIKTINGTLHVSLQDGQVRDIEPGAGRMLGLLSVTQLPRRLALDFSDVTDKGLAFNSVKGDFDLRDGDAYTQNLLLKGPAVNVGIVGRTGLAAEDYDQTVVVTGNTGGPLALAGALAAGPVVGAGVLVLSQLFKDQLQQFARVYYHVSGPWAAPVVERISATAAAGPAHPAAGKESPEESPP